jgi:hypothetical protein
MMTLGADSVAGAVAAWKEKHVDRGKHGSEPEAVVTAEIVASTLVAKAMYSGKNC